MYIINMFCHRVHSKRRYTFVSGRSVRVLLFLSAAMIFLPALLAFPGSAFCEPGWSLDADAADPAYLRENSFGELTYGYTEVVPPDSTFRSCKTSQTEDGTAWEMRGVNLSVWRLALVPQSSRYLLTWDFLFEGAITGGGGRTGFIFGNPASANLMSVEVTAAGSLRLLMWGRQGFENHGKVIFSRQTSAKGPSVKIEARYEIRTGTMVCRVNDGDEILIELKKLIPSAPITIRGVGFFSAVPESTRRLRGFRRGSDSEHEISLLPQWTRTLHRGLSVHAE